MPKNLTREQVAEIERQVQDTVMASGKAPDRATYNKMVDDAVDQAYASTNSFGSNLVRSAKDFGAGIAGTFAHPVETIENLGRLGGAVGIKALRKGADAIGMPMSPATKAAISLSGVEQPANAAGEFYKNRYGGWENIKQTLYEDPVGAAADVASLASAGAGTAAKLGAVSKLAGASRLGSGLNTVAKAGRTISQFTDPLSVAGKVVKLPVKAAVAGNRGRLIESAIADQHSAFKFTPSVKARNPGKDLGRIAVEHEVIPTGASMERLGDKVSAEAQRFDDTVGAVAANKRAPRVYRKELQPALDKTKKDYSKGHFEDTEGAPVAEKASGEFEKHWEGVRPISDARWRGTVKREPGFKLRTPADEVENRIAAGLARPTRDRGISLARAQEAKKAGFQTLRKEASNFAKSGNEVPASWDARMNTYGTESGLIAEKADPLAHKAGLLTPGESLKGINNNIGDMMALETSMKPVVSRMENRDIFSLGAKIMMSHALGAVGNPGQLARVGSMAGMAALDNPILKSQWGHLKYAAATRGVDAASRRLFPSLPLSRTGVGNTFWNIASPTRGTTLKQRVNEGQDPTENDQERAALFQVWQHPGSTERP